jgi:hypothetical protein
MRARLLALAEHRTRLASRAQAERETLAALLAPVDGAASLATALMRTVQRGLEEARRQPLIAVALVALLAALRPRRALTWISRGWSLWRLYRGARGWWLRFERSGIAAGAPRQAP